MKNKLFLRISAVLLCVVSLISMCFVASFSASASGNSVITTDAVRFRSTPEINDDNYITTLGVSETLTLLADSTNGWANVMRENGAKGYCSVDYLQVPSDSSVSFTGKTTDEVNFRKGPSTDYDILDFLDKGQEFVVLDNSDELWVKVQIGSTKGYIYRGYTLLILSVSAEEPTKPADPEVTEPMVTEPTTAAATEPEQEFVPSTDAPSTPCWYKSHLLSADSFEKRTNLSSDFALNCKSVSLDIGEKFKLSVLMTSASVESIITFSSSDKDVATVSKSGLISGVGEGKAVITAAFNGKTSSCTVSVSDEMYVPVIPTEPATVPETTVQTTTEAPATTTPSTTVPVTTEPTEPVTTVPETLPSTFELSASSIILENGNQYMLTSPLKNTTWASSDKTIATVKDGLVTAVGVGAATITASADGKTAECSVKVTKTTTDLTIEYSEIEVSKGKTFYNSADSSASISWTSSDESIATVSNGFITGVKEGVAVISATSSKGSKTCYVTVKAAEPIRFSYAYPNTVAKDEDVNLVAITDKTRTALQFKININGETKTIDATSKKTDGNTIVWTGTTKISQSGTFNVTAYSKLSNKYTSCDNGKTTVFVRENKDLLKETQEDRRASDELIALLASFEGYVGNVYFDSLAGGIPTLGYGKVVYAGDSFYNDMTKTEAYAQLYDTVNNGGYSSNVNSYLQSLDANYNQQQFDALVSFAYNIGYYGLKSDSEIRALILEAKEKKAAENTDKKAAYINGTEVNFRKGAGTEYESLGWLSYPEIVTLVEDKLVNTNWYHIKDSSGREGYVYKDYVTLGVPTVEGDIYLSLIDKDEFTRVVLEYHHASSNCVYGLLYRRVDELDVFYYGDYVRDGDDNYYGYTFTCFKDKNFKL